MTACLTMEKTERLWLYFDSALERLSDCHVLNNFIKSLNTEFTCGQPRASQVHMHANWKSFSCTEEELFHETIMLILRSMCNTTSIAVADYEFVNHFCHLLSITLQELLFDTLLTLTRWYLTSSKLSISIGSSDMLTMWTSQLVNELHLWCNPYRIYKNE